jgi:hypothetical protein
MFRRLISLTLFFTCLAVFVACASGAEEITGTIQGAKVAQVGNMMEVLLTLEGRPETFMVHLSDLQKFGIRKKGENLSSVADLTTMFQEIEATKGWKVKLTCEKTNNQQGPEYVVKKLAKLSGK